MDKEIKQVDVIFTDGTVRSILPEEGYDVMAVQVKLRAIKEVTVDLSMEASVPEVK